MANIVPLVSIGPERGKSGVPEQIFMSGTMAGALSAKSMGLAAALWAATAMLPAAKNSKSGIIYRNYFSNNH